MRKPGNLLCLLFVLTLLPALGALLHSCSDLGCTDNRTSIPLAQFYDFTEPQKTLTLDSLSVYGLAQWSDSLLADSVSGVAQISLPFRQFFDSTQYVISYNNYWNRDLRRNDTLTFYYDAYVYFASIDCGAMYNYTVDSIRYTRNTIDSIAVVRPKITNRNVENIRLYYTPAKL